MAYTVSGSDLTSIANAIRTKGGTESPIEFPSGFLYAIGNIPSGGASNIVTGTFTAEASEKGTAKNISLPYTGNGYPIAAVIYPTAGCYKSGEPIYDIVQQRVVVFWSMVKAIMSEAPDYMASHDKNRAGCTCIYKASTTVATDYNGGGGMGRLYYTSDPTASNTTCARFKSKTDLSVYVANDSYGFLAGTEYTYQILYSA